MCDKDAPACKEHQYCHEFLCEKAMKVTIEIEGTPVEARAFYGLPDVQPLQAAVMDRLQERMVSEIDRFSPEALVGQWLSALPQNLECTQRLFADIFVGGSGQGRQ